MIDDGQGVAVLAIAQQELAFVVGAPEFVGTLGLTTKRCPAREDERGHGVRPGRGDRAQHGWCF
jgi:hypothetical protein